MLDCMWIELFAVSVPDYRGAAKQREKVERKDQVVF